MAAFVSLKKNKTESLDQQKEPMPQVSANLHLGMHAQGKKTRGLGVRLKSALKLVFSTGNMYGLEWGDPETAPPLGYVRDHFLKPYLFPDATVLEIGPGGGRWTRYMLGVKKIYAVDCHEELLNELKRNVGKKNIEFIRNGGFDFPGVPDQAIDFLFSFGTFVHLDLDIIQKYLENMRRILKPAGVVVLQYSDKNKPLAKANIGFSENTPEIMRPLVLKNGFRIQEEDTMTLWHSSLIRFSRQ
jgi:SAM-dependent methyltransferase